MRCVTGLLLFLGVCLAARPAKHISGQHQFLMPSMLLQQKSDDVDVAELPEGPYLLPETNNETSVYTAVWGLERSGTNMLDTAIYQNLQIQTVMQKLSSMAHYNTSFPFWVNRVDGLNPMTSCRQQLPIWKHFWVQASAFSPSNTHHQHTYSPETYSLELNTLDDFDDLWSSWIGYPFTKRNPWKHSLRYVVAVKNPYAWLNSISNTQLGRNLWSGEFPVEDEEGAQVKSSYTDAELIAVWVAYYTKWTQFQKDSPKRIIFVPYERTLGNFTDTMTFLTNRIGAEDSVQFRHPTSQVQMSKAESWREEAEKYLDGQSDMGAGVWASAAIKASLTKTQIAIVNEAMLSDEAQVLVNHFGYTVGGMGAGSTQTASLDHSSSGDSHSSRTAAPGSTSNTASSTTSTTASSAPTTDTQTTKNPKKHKQRQAKAAKTARPKTAV